MLTFLSNIFKKEPKFLSESKFRIVPAFELDGVIYYEFEDVFNTPCTRALNAIKYYEEMRMKCTLDYLQAWTEAQANMIREAKEHMMVPNGKRLNLTGAYDKLNQLEQFNHRLKERLALAIDTDLVYKLASVVYFDGSENPAMYEMKYGLEKIEKWKKHEDVASFFLRQPIQKLVPYLNGQEERIQTYQKVVDKLKQEDWSKVLDMLSSTQKMTYTKVIS